MNVEFVTVARFVNLAEAALARNRLEEEGLQVMLLDELAADGGLGLTTGAFAEIKLQVPESEARKALAILESVFEHDDPRDDESEEIAEEGTARRISSKRHKRKKRRKAATGDDEGIAEKQTAERVAAKSRRGEAEHEDEEEGGLSERDRNADRAFRAAVIGLFFFPLEFYAFWLVLKVWGADQPLRPEKRRKAVLAALITVPYIIAVCIGIRLMCGSVPGY